MTFNNLPYSDEQQKYNYRLLPYQGNWLISDEGEKASYTNLPAGEYVFEVKNIHPNGQTGAVTSLKIVILPHWSQTFAFPAFRFPVIVGRSGLWSTVDQNTAETDGTRNADET